jgi:Spx/MgsR family transcriptional regulator
LNGSIQYLAVSALDLTPTTVSLLLITVFGIKNCDSVKKARKWLEQHNLNYSFVDFRTDGIDAKTISTWISPSTINSLVNKRSTTWKNLNDADRDQISHWVNQIADNNTDCISDLAQNLQAQPTLIKRPVVEHSKETTIGFNANTYQNLFS